MDASDEEGHPECTRETTAPHRVHRYYTQLEGEGEEELPVLSAPTAASVREQTERPSDESEKEEEVLSADRVYVNGSCIEEYYQCKSER